MSDPKLREQLICDEGLRLAAYRDSVGLYTIGVGHLLGETPRMLAITEREAMALLEADIEDASELVGNLIAGVNWLTDLPRWRAIVNMAFNLGHRLGEFHDFIAAVRLSNWPAAAAEMMDSKWAKQVGKRAERLRNVILTGADGAF